jgi:polar amino acid transport system substrate-binding protein
MDSRPPLQDTLVISLTYKNGSIASISYFSNGNKALSKEYLEIFYAGQVFVVDDFKDLLVYSKNKKREKYKSDKGHQEEVKLYLKSIKEGKPSPIPFEELYQSTLVTFKVLESLKTRQTIQI